MNHVSKLVKVGIYEFLCERTGLHALAQDVSFTHLNVGVERLEVVLQRKIGLCIKSYLVCPRSQLFWCN